MERWITNNNRQMKVWEDDFLYELSHRYPSREYNYDVKYITKINGKEAIEKEFGKLVNDDIVLTDERKKHIKERREEDFDFVISHLEQTIDSYDYLLKDGDQKVMFIKKIEKDCHYNNLAVVLSLNDKTLANSIITGMRIGEKTLTKLLKIRKVIDKKK